MVLYTRGQRGYVNVTTFLINLDSEMSRLVGFLLYLYIAIDGTLT